MNCSIQEYYNELYRIFANENILLSTTQLVMLGDCLRALMCGENISYRLEQLYTAVQNIPEVADVLEHYMHEYNKFIEENDIDENEPKADTTAATAFVAEKTLVASKEENNMTNGNGNSVTMNSKRRQLMEQSRSLNSAVNAGGDREVLEQVQAVLKEQAKFLAESLEGRLEMPIEETSAESQKNTKMLLDWTADIYSIASDINQYLNPEEE